MIIDDRLLRVGSSNFNNRSMDFDTECDLAVEAVPGRQLPQIAEQVCSRCSIRSARSSAEASLSVLTLSRSIQTDS
jgi:phospholipase D1/2